MKNQLKILISLLVIFSFFACNENHKSKSKNKKAPTDFVETFEGEITNEYPILEKILYRQEEYDEELKAVISNLKVNESFLSTADDGVRAIIGFYSTRAGTDCWWKMTIQILTTQTWIVN